jgi:hypothetical protein
MMARGDKGFSQRAKKTVPVQPPAGTVFFVLGSLAVAKHSRFESGRLRSFGSAKCAEPQDDTF